jgi:hypothetical protein
MGKEQSEIMTRRESGVTGTVRKFSVVVPAKAGEKAGVTRSKGEVRGGFSRLNSAFAGDTECRFDVMEGF